MSGCLTSRPIWHADGFVGDVVGDPIDRRNQVVPPQRDIVAQFNDHLVIGAAGVWDRGHQLVRAVELDLSGPAAHRRSLAAGRPLGGARPASRPRKFRHPPPTPTPSSGLRDRRQMNRRAGRVVVRCYSVRRALVAVRSPGRRQAVQHLAGYRRPRGPHTRSSAPTHMLRRGRDVRTWPSESVGRCRW
jgi:hypothetical protein